MCDIVSIPENEPLMGVNGERALALYSLTSYEKIGTEYEASIHLME